MHDLSTSGRWQARYRDAAGVQHAGAATFATEADANRWLTTVEADLGEGRPVLPAKGRMVFAEWAEQYMAGAVHLRPTTRRAKRSSLDNHILPAFGSLPLVRITPLHVRRFVEALNTTLAPPSVRSVYIVLRAMLNAAVDAEMLMVSTCRGIKLPAERPTSKAFLTPEEIDRLAAEVRVDYQPMIYVAAYLGLRWSEVAGLRVGRLDLLAATLTVAETNAYVGGFADVKSPAARRTIALAPFLAEMLAAHLARRGLTAADATALVFCAPDGGRLYANNWHRRVWQPDVAASGVAVTFHGLRHTSVGLMVATGAHPK
jgi:integrase